MDPKHSSKVSPHSQKPTGFFLLRTKALIIDLFMIYTPILYGMTYLILGSKEAFQANQFAIFICVFLYGIIDALFCSLSFQTPGMRAQNLFLFYQNNHKAPFFLAFLRFFLWLLSIGLVFGLVFPFLHKDRKTFHDWICHTSIAHRFS